MARKRTPIRTTQRCDPRELPAGTDVAIASTRPDVLTFRIDDVTHEAPIFVVSVPTAWNVGILIDGETHWIETTERYAWQAGERLLDEKEATPC